MLMPITIIVTVKVTEIANVGRAFFVLLPMIEQ